ncbi:ThiF family protein [Apiospora hydei]|uniref:Ubiquitin-like 1-activating enzyme E1A n=1 Tax=Apiospora hydei TaxID=1337664 RepID=A0ABR1X476_9PEZI
MEGQQQPKENDKPAPSTPSAPLPERPAESAAAPVAPPVPEQQPGDANGVANHMSMPLPPMDGHNPMLPDQHHSASFTLPQHQMPDSNGVAFTNPEMMMMPGQPFQFAGVPPPQDTNGNGLAHGQDKDITADEIALYDRQIRLWGMQAQKRIQGATVLLITMRALANEIAKNLVLAGIGSLTVVDDQPVTEADLGAQFFLTKENLGQNRAQAASESIRKLNPRVQVYADAESIMAKGASYFAGFDIIIATDLNPTTLAFINTATRLHERQFYATGTHGLYGYIFSDLIELDYVLQRDKANVPTKIGAETRSRSVIDVKEKEEGGKKIEMVTKRELYSTWDLASETSLLPAEYRGSKRRLKTVTPALSCLRTLWGFQSIHNRNPGHNHQDLEYFVKKATSTHASLGLPAETLRSEFLRKFLGNVGGEIAPVTAVLGGQLAQDVINVLGRSQPPIQNMVIFDGDTMQAQMYPMHPEVPLGRAQLQLDMGMPMGGMPAVPNADPNMYAQFPDMTNPPM